ncbi:hypothetical protein FD723_15025 [Nostoc sp. C052]|uniref:hypothetical protein n=1 Tax=Nostoc sp. C052 TaxID=2576902 RepID=UPI0015C33D6B|nr:hypothetical protein [Nostoc sp. C052]QLE41602.1 hypothetical protein FD723_15025 [Nostoc sp. C052]
MGHWALGTGHLLVPSLEAGNRFLEAPPPVALPEAEPLRIRSQPGGWERGTVPSTQYPVPTTLGTDAQ